MRTFPDQDEVPQFLDSGNSTDVAGPAVAALFTGAWFATRSQAFVRQLVAVSAVTATPLGGTFTFEYSEDGITPTITEVRVIATFTVVTATDTVVSAAHGLSNGQRVVLASSGTLPGGLEIDTAYYVVGVTVGTFQLALTEGGTPIDITTLGSGVHTWSVPGGFVGAYRDTYAFASALAFAHADTKLSEVRVIWSPDGVTQHAGSVGVQIIPRGIINGGFGNVQPLTTMTDRYVRIEVLAGSTYPTAVEVDLWLSDVGHRGTFLALSAALAPLAAGLLTRAVIAGLKPDGTFSSVPLNGSGNLISADFVTEVAKGNVEGHSLVAVRGHSSNFGTGTSPAVIREGGTTYTFPAVAAPIVITSTSALDTAGGTGTQEVFLEGIDSSGAYVSETLPTNGLGTATSVNSYLRLNRCVCGAAGATGQNQGTITGVIGADQVINIPPGIGTNDFAIYTVPLGFRGYIISGSGSALQNTASSTCEFRVRSQEFGGSSRIRDRFSVGTTSAGAPFSYRAPIVLPPRSTLSVLGIASNNNTTAQVRFDVLLVAEA